MFVVAALSLYLFNTYENQKAKEQVENVLLLIHEDIPNLEMKQENSTVIEKPLAIIVNCLIERDAIKKKLHYS